MYEKKDSDVEIYLLRNNEKFKQLVEEKYVLVGDVEIASLLLRKFDLSQFKIKGRKARYEIYKKLNELLEKNRFKSLEKLLKTSVEGAGIELDKKTSMQIENLSKMIDKKVIDENIQCIEDELLRNLTNIVPLQRQAAKRIIAKSLKKIYLAKGKITKEDIFLALEEDLVEEKHSPYMLENKQNMLDAIYTILSNKETEKLLNRSAVDILRSVKEKGDQEWIRRLIKFPKELTRDQIEELQATIDADIQYECKFSLKGEEKAKRVREFLESLELPEDVINNVMQNKITYKSVMMALKNNMNKEVYKNVREGNEELARLAMKFELSQEQFDIAQNIFEITKNRKVTSIPSVQTKAYGKYRGRMLNPDDPLILFVGNVIDCCQVIGKEAESSVVHSATQKNGNIFVVEELDKDGKPIRIIAESWVWRNKERLCFDNIELDDIRVKKNNLEDTIIKIYLEAGRIALEKDRLSLEARLKCGRISKEDYDTWVLKDITVGMSYTELKSLQKFKSIETILPEEKVIYNGNKKMKLYCDSKRRQVVIIQSAMRKDQKERID